MLICKIPLNSKENANDDVLFSKGRHRWCFPTNIFQSSHSIEPFQKWHLDNQMWTVKGGSRATTTSKMERFVIIVNDWKPLNIITMHSILDVAAALDSPQMSHLLSRKCLRWSVVIYRPRFFFHDVTLPPFSAPRITVFCLDCKVSRKCFPLP